MKILYGLSAFLIIIIVLGIVNATHIVSYRDGYINGKKSVEMPDIYVSYVDRDYTNCTIDMPFWFAELDAEIVTFENGGSWTNAPLLYNSWYVHINQYDWECVQDPEYYLNEHSNWCRCRILDEKLRRYD